MKKRKTKRWPTRALAIVMTAALVTMSSGVTVVAESAGDDIEVLSETETEEADDVNEMGFAEVIADEVSDEIYSEEMLSDTAADSADEADLSEEDEASIDEEDAAQAEKEETVSVDADAEEIIDEEVASVIAMAAGIVARIGDVDYLSLDEAVLAAADDATIDLVADVETAGFNLSKNLTLNGNYKTITFTSKGIALWGKSLTINDATVNMNGVGATPYGEWSWMTICASKNASLTLNNTTMTMDGEGAGNAHAIYFTGNNKLNLNESTLTIKNYAQDALEWDGGDGGYNVNLKDSTYISDNNRSGFTGTFYATIDHSNVNVINSRGNGSNGTYFTIKDDSHVAFANNRNWGISAWRIDMSNNSSLTAQDNGYSGIWTRVLNVDGTSLLDVERNGNHATGASTNAGIVFYGNGK